MNEVAHQPLEEGGPHQKQDIIGQARQVQGVDKLPPLPLGEVKAFLLLPHKGLKMGRVVEGVELVLEGEGLLVLLVRPPAVVVLPIPGVDLRELVLHPLQDVVAEIPVFQEGDGLSL